MRWMVASLIALAGAMMGPRIQAATVFVSPYGLDGNDGTVRSQVAAGRGPVASVGRALGLLRAIRGARAELEADNIVLLPGRYTLTETLILGPEDSGSATAPFTIRAEQPGTVWLTGSARVEGLQPVDGQRYLRKQLSFERGFHVLWVNGKLAVRARSPNRGGYFIGASNVVPAIAGDRMQRPRNPYNVINTQKLILPAEARKSLASAHAPEDAAVLVALHSWTSSAHRIVHWDDVRGAVTVQPVSLWSFLRFGPDQRFALENLPEFLDDAGEWWLSPMGELRYLARTGETARTISAEAPHLERLVWLQGTERRPIQHVRIEGLRFAYSAAWTAPFIDSQAATSVPAALVAEHARQIQITGCRFENLGGHGLWLRKGSQLNIVRHNVFAQLGAGAIRLGEVTMPGSEEERAQGNKLTDNLIEDTGLLFPGAVGIWLGQSGGNLVAHNEIRRTSYTGISLGWTWGFGGSVAKENVIEHNLLRHIGQGLLSDLGGIYTLGISHGTIIRFNRIEDVRSFRKGGATAWGVYLDEGSSGILVENNWVDGTTGGGLHLHYGNDNTVRNNVFKNGEVAQLRRSRRTDSALTVERNVIWADTQPIWDKEWLDDEVKTSRNIIVASTPPTYNGSSRPLRWAQEQDKERASVWLQTSAADCLIRNGCILPDPVIKATGFQKFDVRQAGIRDSGKILTLAPP